MELQSIAFIPDGNRRYAAKAGIRLDKAYRLGVEKSWNVLRWLEKYPSIKTGTFYTLSLENLRREKNELNLLFSIFDHALDRARKEKFLAEKQIRLRFSGRLSLFPRKLQDKMMDLEEKTAQNSRKTVNLALGYSGQSEIVDAAKKIALDARDHQLDLDSLDEKKFHEYLYTDLPDPDLIVRTSGTRRLSGFLTYQSAYSELFFCDRYWPEFSETDLAGAIESYIHQQRNFGK